MSDVARMLAIAKDLFLPDHDGREVATKALLEDFKEQCRKANLNLGSEKGVDWVSLWHPPVAKVFIGPYSEDVQKALGSPIEFDPIQKKYFVNDGTDPLSVLAGHITTRLILDTEKVQKKKGQ